MTRLLVFTFLSIPLIGAYIMFALGIVVIYRASRVLNLAHGAMAMAPAYLYYSLTRTGLPTLLAVLVAVVAGAGLGVLVEWVFVRRLRAQGPTAQTVGTVAVTGLLIAMIGKFYGTAAIQPPRVFPEGQLSIAGAAVRYGELGVLVVGLACAAALLAFFRFTQLGLALRGAAQNRTAAILVGINPQLAASAAWALGGALAALAGVLLAAVTNLNPYTLSLAVLPAFVAALLGGLGSLVGALVGAVIAGLAFGLVPLAGTAPLIGRALRLPGTPQLMLTVLTLAILVVRGKKLSGADSDEAGLGFGRASVAVRRSGVRPSTVLLFAVLLVWPFVVPFSLLGSSLLAVEFAVIAFSLVVLTGWVGQISLAQATFVGVGALTTAGVARTTGIGFPLDVVAGALTAGLAAVLLGAIALRVRGLYLAVATLIFAWMGDAFLFPSPWLGLGSGSSTLPNQRIGHAGAYISLDLTNRKVLFVVFVAVLMTVAVCLSNVRDARTGRALSAIRGSEMAAASLGIDVVRYKLVAFAMSGVLAGLGGGLLMVEQRTVVSSQFFFTVSLQFLAIAVVGGLTSLGGAVAAGIVFAALTEIFFRVDALTGWLDIVSAGLLAAVLLLYPAGLAGLLGRLGAVGHRLAERTDVLAAPAVSAAGGLLRHAASRLMPAQASDSDEAVGVVSGNDWMGAQATPKAVLTRADKPRTSMKRPKVALPAKEVPAERTDPRLLLPVRLAARDVTVQFGGLTAVGGASLQVHEAEIVGLIGPNGAGKTTLFNAILGLNQPQEGQIELYGQDVTATKAHERAALGVARTFQVLQLFRGLTVFDNLLVATHLHNSSSPLGNLIASTATVRDEHACRERVRTVLQLLGLEDVADAAIDSLPFGVLRMVELGRALVTGANLLLLDEAASGLNDTETDRLVEVIWQVRALGVSVLLIEHDIRMVNAACDYLYVLDQGKVISQGKPEVVSNDPQVIAAYLGSAPEPTGTPTLIGA